jgi:hypothetical protein
MNQLLKRYLGLLGTLVCTAVLFGALITQTVQAQAQANSITLSAEPSSLPVEVGKEVFVTIFYEVIQSTRLYYYPPDGFIILDNDNAASDPDNDPSSGLNGSARIAWDVEGQGSKTVNLSVAQGATPGLKLHGAFLASDEGEKGELQLTQPSDAQPIDPPSPADDQPPPIPGPGLELKITNVISDINESVEPGHSFYITVTIQNKGGSEADNVKLVFGSTTDLLLLDESLTEEVGSVPAGEHKNQRVSLTILDNLLEDEYKLSIELYVNEESVDEQEVPIQVIRSLPPTQIELNSTVTELEAEPGTASLELVFTNTGAALPENARLVLRYPDGMLSVLEAMINEESKPGENDNAGHAWGELPSFDGGNEETLELTITELKIDEGYTSDKEITVAFVDGDENIWSVPLPQDTVKKLAEFAPRSANASDLDNSPTITHGQPVTNSGTSLPLTPSPTLSGGVNNDDGDDENKTPWLNWLLGGLGGLGILLLLGIASYFLLRPRKRAKSAPPMPVTSGTTGMILPPGTSPVSRPVPPPLSLQPYLRSSDGRSFAITTFPFTIGRGENNSLVIDESFPQWQSVSRTHARIVQHAQGLVIEDQGSQNRLRVQGRLTERNLLRNGWQVRIGGVEFTFHDGSNASGGTA